MNCRNYYNIIFAGGTIPPMMAVLMAVKNGYETYIYTDRGRSFSGIESAEGFHNMGFDTEKVQFMDGEKAFNCAINTMKKIKTNDEKAYFYIYTGESRGLKCAALAANSGLSAEDFHIFMLEDGIDSYKKFARNYGENAAYEEIYLRIYTLCMKLTKRKWLSAKLAGKTAAKLQQSAKKGGAAKRYMDSIAENRFKQAAHKAGKLFAQIISSGSNRHDDSVLKADYRWPFALAALENYTYILQDKGKVYDTVKAIGNRYMLEYFDVEHDGADSRARVKYENLAQKMAELSDEQMNKYLGIVFGRYSDEVRYVFSRQNRADAVAPKKKLVYINARFDTMFVHPVTNRIYGTGGIKAEETNITSYEALDERYKSVFLFAHKEDWQIMADAFSEAEQYKDAPQNVINQAKAELFNIYADYVFVIKLIYILYGDRYDIIVKNHPRMDFGTSSEWVYQKIGYGDDKYIDYGKILDKAFINFHKHDSMGRYIGVVNGSLSTECFEYTDADVSFGGQPSSVYNGLSDKADIPFIIADTDADITGRDDAHISHSAVSGRYSAGKMKYTAEDGTVKDTFFCNSGNLLKSCSTAATKLGESSLAQFYDGLFAEWLKKAYPQAKDIDEQGFAVM
ncbi:MAG: hypothetical protein IJO54_00050 [Oscillospiraceae bacterium]|nr:hypothetical protein [Oscillospiraceae bacterium]